MSTKEVADHLELLLSSSTGLNFFREFIRTLAVSGQLSSNFGPTDDVTDLVSRCSKYVQVHPEMSEPRFSIPAHWEWVSLASIAQHQLGKMLNTSKMKGVNRPYLRSVNIRQDGTIDLSDVKEMLLSEEETLKYSVCMGDIFINEGGDVGRSAIFNLEVESPLVFQNALHRIRPVCEISSEYIQLVLWQAKNQGVIAEMSSGVTIQHFSASALRKLAIPLPPLSEQLKIVERVSEISSFCDLIQQELITSQNFSTAARRSAVDAISKAQSSEEFQVAWNRIQSHWGIISEGVDGVKELRQLILGIAFSGLFTKKIDLHQDGWRSTTLGEECDVRDGTHDSPKRTTSGRPLVTSKNLKNGVVDLSDSYLISEKDFLEISKRSRVDKFDVLISMIGTVGQVAIVDREAEFAIKNVGLIKTGSELLARFVTYYLASPQAKSYINVASSGGVQKFLSLGKLRTLPIGIPNSQVQDEVVLILDQLMSFCDELETKTTEVMRVANEFAHSLVAVRF